MNDEKRSSAKRKRYILVIMLFVIGIGFFLDAQKQPSPTSDRSKQGVASITQLNAPQSKTVTETISSASASEIPNERIAKKLVIAKNETGRKTLVDDTYTQSSEEEVLVANPDMLATGEFADQINLANDGNDCSTPCANESDVNLPAQGDLSDQINKDAIMQQALLKNPDIREELKLIEVSADSDPPTELGAYTPLPQ